MRYIAFLAALVAALTLSTPAAAAADWTWPVRGDVVTKYKNGDDPYAADQHRGIDIAAPVGTRVDAAVAGRVTFAGVAGSSGLTVSVRTADGRYDVSYLHLSAAGVRAGDNVDRGDRIGAVGTSGRRSVDQPHLHFGVRDAGERHSYRDPLDFLPPIPPHASEPQPSPAPVAAREPAAAAPAGAPAAAAPAIVGAPALAAPAPAAVLPGPGSAPAAALGPAESLLVQEGPRPRPQGAGGRVSHVSHAAAQAIRSPDPALRVTLSDLQRGARPRVPRPEHSARSGDAAAAGRGPAVRTPAAGPGLSVARPDPQAPPIAVPDRRRAQAPRDTGGIDAGWLAAVIGLVAAATCLGRPETTRRATRGGRRAVVAFLRPLAGRG